jgi:hypothetical protein
MRKLVQVILVLVFCGKGFGMEGDVPRNKIDPKNCEKLATVVLDKRQCWGETITVDDLSDKLLYAAKFENTGGARLVFYMMNVNSSSYPRHPEGSIELNSRLVGRGEIVWITNMRLTYSNILLKIWSKENPKITCLLECIAPRSCYKNSSGKLTLYRQKKVVSD